MHCKSSFFPTHTQGSSFVEHVDWFWWRDGAVIVLCIWCLCSLFFFRYASVSARILLTFFLICGCTYSILQSHVCYHAPIRCLGFSIKLWIPTTAHCSCFLLTALSRRFIRHIPVCGASVHLSPHVLEGQQRIILPPSALRHQSPQQNR